MTAAYFDRTKGCLFGGAVGDALGYPVEFCLENTIFNHYGPKGITSYEFGISPNQTALISDDTQMTLFTAVGLLYADACRNHLPGAPTYRRAVEQAYLDWLHTQDSQERPQKVSWLLQERRLFSRRAPGNTCLSSLRIANQTPVVTDYIAANRRNSKGCGSVMRIAPLALHRNTSDKSMGMEAAQISAITHAHSLGYMPSVVLCHVIRRLVFTQTPPPLKSLILDGLEVTKELFAGDQDLPELERQILLAIELSENTDTDLNNIHRLGEGWVADEALTISLYCSLRHENDFSAGIIAAVNHKGDSDSTGAITGNILGAKLGFSNIDSKWIERLELADVIETIALDLCADADDPRLNKYLP